MNIKKDSLELSVNSPNSGEGVESINSKFNSDEMTVSFNSKYLIDISSQIEDETIIMNLKEPGSPVLIRDLSDNQFITSLLGLGVLLVGAKSQSISRNDSSDIAKGILAIGPDISRRRFSHFS